MFGRRRDETYYRSSTRRRWGRTNPNRRAAGLKYVSFRILIFIKLTYFVHQSRFAQPKHDP